MRHVSVLVVYSALLAVSAGHLHAAYVARTGFVTLQFDDTHELHYSRVFPALEQHGLRASFGYVTEASDLGIDHGEAWKVQEIYLAGNEIQDHTTRHDYMWATHVDTLDDGVDNYVPYTFADVAEWDSLCERSLFVLSSLGIRVTGWNEPGGGGGLGCVPGHPQWKWVGRESDSLYQLIAHRYTYALGYGVFPNTAHMNLRGHNCPDRYPFFSVPYNEVDNLGMAEVKTGIADAVASGLWYLAVSHVQNEDQAARAESLIEWLDETGIEVLTCKDGVDRARCGLADPFENQIAQAGMLTDLDSNGKPDGFIGDCAWDTLTAPPVEGVRCLRVYGDARFICYGPMVGDNEFSIWLKSATGSPSVFYVVYTGEDFDWNCMGWVWTTIDAPSEWTKFDGTACPDFAMSVDDATDRIEFLLKATPLNPVLVACPALMYVPATAGSPQPDGEKQATSLTTSLVVSPNPVRVGTPLEITSQEPASQILLCDVLGRCVLTGRPSPQSHQVTLSTQGLAPGIFFVGDSSTPGRRAKVVVLR